MIIDTKVYSCRKCQSEDLVKNGTNASGISQYHCKACGAYGILERTERATEEKKGLIINVYQERSSMRGIERAFGVSRRTLSACLKEQANGLPPLEETLQPVECKKIPMLDVDELRSFVFRSKDKVWVWIAMNRETREIVASACGDRSENTCRILWDRVPSAYKETIVFSDYWSAYRAVIPSEQQRPVGKETRETAHIERWNNTLRQQLARFP